MGGHATHAKMYMLVSFVICASQCCVFSCVICPVHALFSVHLSFISSGKLGTTHLTSQQSPRWWWTQGASRVESSCSVELLWDPKDSAVRCRRVLTRWWFLLRTLYCRASLHFAVARTTATFTPPFGVCVLYGVGGLLYAVQVVAVREMLFHHY